MRVVHPPRAALAERHERQPLAVARHQMQPALDRLQQLVVGGRVALEHHDRRHVHVRGRVLQVQERRVESGQAISGHGVLLGNGREQAP